MKKKKRYRLTKEKYLNDEEQAELNRILEKYHPTNPRDTVLIWLGIHTGARATELLNLSAADIDFSQKSVFIHGIKASDDREIPLPKWLFKRLTALPVAENGQVFDISYIRFYQIWGEYRPVKKKVHSLRHTFAINLYRKTKDLRLLQVALGHRSWKNTLIYAEYQFKTDELRQALLG